MLSASSKLPKFKTRYATLGFSDRANLDEGRMWADRLRARGADCRRGSKIGALVKKAVS
jgi:hypothetical protein